MTKEIRVEHNYVVGFVRATWGGLVDGAAVYNPERTIRLEVDHSKPITLDRCAEIMSKARELSGRELVMISIRRSIYSKTPGNECGDFAETCYMDKKWDYTASTNSMVIYDRGEPVYANDDGAICTDQAALYDSL